MSTARASSTRRRDASRRVSAAMVSTVRVVVTALSRPCAAPSRRMPSRRSSRLIRAGSTACTRTPRATRSRTRSGTAVAVVVGRQRHGERVAGPLDRPGRRQPRLGRRGDVGQVQLQLALAEQLGEGARCGDPAPVEDDHPVADPLDLADQVRVEQHRDAARPSAPARCRARRPGRAGPARWSARPGRRAPARPPGRPPARAAAASPSRSRPRRSPARSARPTRARQSRCSAAVTSIPDSRTCRASTSAAVSHGWYRKSSGR